ncbi:MAG: RNA polymerase factor sigma-54 [bacterium]|nr:RNA polymerase factor sigma-54 [bacterium]
MLKQELLLKQTQKLVMTPEMRQSIHMLQMPLLELKETIEQELVENPMLELVKETETVNAEDSSIEESLDAHIKEELEQFSKLDRDWQEYYSQTHEKEDTREKQEKRDYAETLITNISGLREHLFKQLHLVKLSDDDYKIGEVIINEINDDGYLQSSVNELASITNVPPKSIEKILGIIQQFDPAGVGARTIDECLLIQIKSMGKENTYNQKIVKYHLGDIGKKNYKSIANDLNISECKVIKEAGLICSLEPKPGRQYNPVQIKYITPDVTIKKVAEEVEYAIVINNEELPMIRINPLYRKLVQSCGEEKAKKFLLEKFKSAIWLLKSIKQRHATISKVTKHIVKYQKQFLEKGLSHLKPLTLKEVADALEVHQSTISRTISNKYIQTPHGLLPLKYFFSGGVLMSNNPASSTYIKAKIRHLIENEDHKKPISDQKIADKLKALGINIARRTVAKYRESLNILPSSLRKS